MWVAHAGDWGLASNWSHHDSCAVSHTDDDGGGGAGFSTTSLAAWQWHHTPATHNIITQAHTSGPTHRQMLSAAAKRVVVVSAARRGRVPQQLAARLPSRRHQQQRLMSSSSSSSKAAAGGGSDKPPASPAEALGHMSVAELKELLANPVMVRRVLWCTRVGYSLCAWQGCLLFSTLPIHTCPNLLLHPSPLPPHAHTRTQQHTRANSAKRCSLWTCGSSGSTTRHACHTSNCSRSAQPAAGQPALTRT